MPTSITRINPKSLPEAGKVGYSQISVAPPGRLAFVSGQVAWRPNGGAVPGSLAEQTAIVIDNLKGALKALEASPQDIVQLRVYLTDLNPETQEIVMAGISRFRIGHEVEGFTPYRKAAVSWAGFGRDLGPVEADTGFDRPAFMALLSRYFSALSLSTDWDSMKDAEDELLINSLCMLCPFEPEEKQALLEAPSLTTRRETLVTLIQFTLRGGTAEETLQ